MIASTFTALTLSDFLQIACKAAEDRGLGEGSFRDRVAPVREHHGSTP
jgi:hypothetical protein